MRHGDEIIQESDSLSVILVVCSGELELKKRLFASLNSVFVDEELLRRCPADIFKTGAQTEISLGIVGRFEIVGEEGLLSPRGNYEYSVCCKSQEAKVLAFKTAEFIQNFPWLSLSWKSMIDQKLASRIQTFRKAFKVGLSRHRTTLSQGDFTNRMLFPTIYASNSPETSVHKAFRRHPSLTSKLQQLKELRGQPLKIQPGPSFVVEEARMFLGEGRRQDLRLLDCNKTQTQNLFESTKENDTYFTKLNRIVGFRKTLTLGGLKKQFSETRTSSFAIKKISCLYD